MIDDQSRPRRVPASIKRNGVYWVLVPEEALDVAIANETGHHVFQLCDGTRSAATIAHEIAEATGASIDTVTSDVTNYLTALNQAGLITIEND